MPYLKHFSLCTLQISGYQRLETTPKTNIWNNRPQFEVSCASHSFVESINYFCHASNLATTMSRSRFTASLTLSLCLVNGLEIKKKKRKRRLNLQFIPAARDARMDWLCPPRASHSLFFCWSQQQLQKERKKKHYIWQPLSSTDNHSTPAWEIIKSEGV